MRAAVFYEARDMRVEEIPQPEAGPEDVVVEVSAVGVCGSDVEYYSGRSPVGTPTGKGPLVLGHEFAGRVVEVGSAVNGGGLAVGDRVAVNPIQSCARCDRCRAGQPQFCSSLSVLGVTTDGGFAEYARTNVAHAYKLPDSLSDAQGAFVEMLAAGVNAVDKADIRPGDLTLIYGPGPVGLSMLQLARRRGAEVVVVGTRDYRLAVAEALGAASVMNTREPSSPHYVDDLGAALQEHHGRPPDRVIVATGSIPANEEALAVAGPGATIVFMGVTGPDDTVAVPMLASLIGDRTIRFSLWYPFQWPRTIALLEQGVVDTAPIITHRTSLDRLSQSIEQVMAREDGVIKTVVEVAKGGAS